MVVIRRKMKKTLLIIFLILLLNNIYCKNNLKISDKLYRQISGVWGGSFDQYSEKVEYSWGESFTAISITIDLASNYPSIIMAGVGSFIVTSVEDLGNNKVLLKYIAPDSNKKSQESIITIINYDILSFDENDPNIALYVILNSGPELRRFDGPRQLLTPTKSDVYLYKEAYKGNDASNKIRALKKGERLEKLDREPIEDTLDGKKGYFRFS